MSHTIQSDDSFLVYSLKSSLSLQFFLLSAVFLVAWRQWKFVISSRLYPNTPQTYPYWIPFIGHVIPFIRDGDGTVTRARLYFKNTRKPFKLVIMGEPLYIITSPQDAAILHKQVSHLSMDRFVTDIMEQFGASPSAVRAMWKPVPEHKDNITPVEFEKRLQKAAQEPLEYVCQLLFRLNLNPGEQIEAIQACLLETIQESVAWDNMPESLILSDSPDSRNISLVKWSQHVLLQGATTAFFGKALLRLEPDLCKHFCEFDDNSWKLSYKMPVFLAKDVHRSKDFTRQAMRRYFELPRDMRADASPLIHSIEVNMRAAGIGSDDIGTLVLMFYWVINVNAWKASFWILVHIINNPTLRQSVINEITPILSASDTLSPTEVCSRLGKCENLLAAYYEGLRISASSVSVRTVTGPAHVGNLVLEHGAKVLMPYRQMLLDEKVFGSDANVFNHLRFLHNPALAKSPSFRPFGGGTNLCPGRALAQKEILWFVALAIGKLDLVLGEGCDGSHRNIPDQENNPYIGILRPVIGQDVHVRVRKPVLI